MSALLACLLALGAMQASDAVHARGSCEPAEAEIGQPLALELVLEHPASVRVRVDPKELRLGDAWTELEPASAITKQQGAIAHTRVSWRIAALEPGEHELALPLARYEHDGLDRKSTRLNSSHRQ